MKKKGGSMESDELEIVESSGNPYADLGLSDAQGRQLKTRLILRLIDHLERATRDGMSQRQIAKRLGTTQPKVSDLLNCKFGGVSFERAITWLCRMGCDIEVLVGQPQERHVATTAIKDMETFIEGTLDRQVTPHFGFITNVLDLEPELLETTFVSSYQPFFGPGARHA